jgi:hypothetical protein
VVACTLSHFAQDRFEPRSDETTQLVRKHEATKWQGLETPDAIDTKRHRNWKD